MATKKAAKKSASPKSDGKPKAAGHAKEKRPANSVRIRMYCQGLGDCFLLSFPRGKGQEEFHLLIDCGVILGTPDAEDRMRQVVDHIAATTGGTIDLLIVTHEHWDHVSGFVQARKEFEKIWIEQTWLAWTEDPNDPLANKLRREREEKKKKLALAMAHYRQYPFNDEDDAPRQMLERLAGLTSFLGIGQSTVAFDDLKTTADAMEFLREQNAKYLKPGVEPPELAGLRNVEFFVLGPPTNEKLLKKDLPTKKGHETYEEDAHSHALTALVGLDVPDENGQHEHQPFEDRYGMSIREALTDPYFAQTYDNGLDDHPAAWRRIDDVGMFAATDLALKLDADTNNTSLAIAIRLPNGNVLLFPGDAQVGNWESWHEIEFHHDGKTTTKQLLADTVVYKVGHHGSHNATLSTRGLEMMESPQLMAFLPVDEEIAHNNKGWTRMPFVPLMTELRERTQGRIIRIDHERSHPVTDGEGDAKPIWTASEEKFDTKPKRSLYLETYLPL